MIQVNLPWPPKALSPNARSHWAEKARKAKQYRADCAWAVRAVLGVAKPAPKSVRVDLEFVPATAHRRDGDNLLAAIKSGLDGVADALRVDDSRFEYGPLRVSKPRKGKPGVVVMTLTLDGAS